jgi:hypothetical protein
MDRQLLREHLVQANRHVAEVERHIAQQQQLVDGLPLESRVREAAVKMLTILKDTVRALEQHRDLIRTWLERGE